MMLVFVQGELVNLEHTTAIVPAITGPGCIVQFTGGGARAFTSHGPACFATAITAENLIYYMDEDGHEC